MSTIKVGKLDISKVEDSIKTSGSRRQIEISVFFIFIKESFYNSSTKTSQKS